MRFQCQSCRQIIGVDNSDLGHPVQCGHCQEVANVPQERVAPGVVINDFIILEELGRGGMGIVYLAYQISLDRPAAIKVLAGSYARSAEFVTGFIKEARAAAKLNHPHIVQAYAVGEDEGVYFFAMEMVDGETMKECLKREQVISIEQSLTIIQEIAEALDYAWKEAGLIHRDIKPDNIMITKKNRAKLADLGLARVTGDVDDGDSDEVMGTPQYISPEHLTGAPMDIRSDLYSLGATFYNFVTGEFPFKGRNATEIAKKHLQEPLISPHKLNSKIPKDICSIIGKMMQKDPKNRYQSAEDLVDDLRMVRRGKAPLSISGVGSSGKKTLFVNTASSKNKTHSTGIHTRFHKTSSTGLVKTTSTSMYKTQDYDDELTNSQKIHKKRLQLAKKSKTKLFLMLFFLILAIVGGTFFIIHKRNQKNAPSKPVVNKPVKPTQDFKVPEIKETLYTKSVSNFLKIAKSANNDDEILVVGDNIFKNKKPNLTLGCDKDAHNKFLEIYVPIDEKRLGEARKKFIEKEEEAEKAYAKIEEAEKAKIEVEKAKLAAIDEKKKIKEEAEKARLAAIEQEKINFINKTKNLHSKFRRDYLNSTKTANFAVALDVLKKAKQEFINAPEKYKEIVKPLKTWSEKMITPITSVKKWENLLNKGSSDFRGIMCTTKKGFGKIVSFENKKVKFKDGLTLKLVTVDYNDLDDGSKKRINKKIIEILNDKNLDFFQKLLKTNFKNINDVPDGWQDELDALQGKETSEYNKIKTTPLIENKNNDVTPSPSFTNNKYTIFFDFGTKNTTTKNNYNNITSVNDSITNIIDSNGTKTSVNISMSGWEEIASKGMNKKGGEFESSAKRDYIYSENSIGIITITGLNNTNLYKITAFASRMRIKNRDIIFAIGTKNITINVASNQDTNAIFDKTKPVNGTIVLTLTENNEENFAYINALKIEELD